MPISIITKSCIELMHNKLSLSPTNLKILRRFLATKQAKMFTNSIRCHRAVTIAVHTTSRIFNIEVQNFRKNYNKVAHIAKKHYLCTTKSAPQRATPGTQAVARLAHTPPNGPIAQLVRASDS